MVVKEVVWTKDGSPSYVLRREESAEAMHHSVGAYSETQYIYGPVVRGCFELAAGDDSLRGPHFLSLGLGLGYNEFLIAAEASKNLMEWTCVSYESEAFLRTDFLDYLFERPMAEEKAHVYDSICQRFAEGLVPKELDGGHLGTAQDCVVYERTTKEMSARLRAELRAAHEEGRWLLEPALCLKTSIVPRKINGFLWDAFSRKTSPELWEKSALTEFLIRTRAPRAFFSTYASFGDLKGALRAAGFQTEIRAGFAEKRESCLARA